MINSWSENIILKKVDDELFTDLKFSNFFAVSPCEKDFDQLILFLHQEEKKYFDTFKFLKRKQTYLIGRYCAKKAISLIAEEESLQNIYIDRGVLSQPIVINQSNIQTSITHCDDLACAIGFCEQYPMGIDLEKINKDKVEVIKTQITANETKFFELLSCEYEKIYTILWTAKEALSKVLRTGMMTPFSLYELDSLKTKESLQTKYFTFEGTYKNFAQYKVVSFEMNGYICSIVYPKNCEIYL